MAPGDAARSAGAFAVFSAHRADTRTLEYKGRRKHAKTAFGCLPCRQKRVKCDELKPSCARCQRNQRTCVYDHRRPQRHPDGAVASFAITGAPAPASASKTGTPEAHLLSHLLRSWTDILPMPRTDDMLDVFRSDAAIRCTMLALAASHLRHGAPHVISHRVAEHYQQSVALREYQASLNTPVSKLGLSGLKTLLANAMLLNMLAFTLPQSDLASDGQPDVKASWVFNTAGERLDWLAIQAGLRPFLYSQPLYLNPLVNSLANILLGPGNDGWQYGSTQRNLDQVPSLWIDFFDLAATQPAGCDVPNLSGPGGVYRPVVIMLCSFLRAGPSAGNIVRHFAIMQKMGPEFRAFLYQRDERALWLFARWFAMLARIESKWWLDPRVERDLEAIRTWLYQARVTARPGAEGEMWRELMMELDAA